MPHRDRHPDVHPADPLRKSRGRRAHHLRGEPAGPFVRAGLPGRGALCRGVRLQREGRAADHDREAAAARHRPGDPRRYPAVRSGRADRARDRLRGRGAGIAGLRPRADPARSPGGGVRERRLAGRAEHRRCRAVQDARRRESQRGRVAVGDRHRVAPRCGGRPGCVLGGSRARFRRGVSRRRPGGRLRARDRGRGSAGSVGRDRAHRGDQDRPPGGARDGVLGGGDRRRQHRDRRRTGAQAPGRAGGKARVPPRPGGHVRLRARAGARHRRGRGVHVARRAGRIRRKRAADRRAPDFRRPRLQSGRRAVPPGRPRGGAGDAGAPDLRGAPAGRGGPRAGRGVETADLAPRGLAARHRRDSPAPRRTARVAGRRGRARPRARTTSRSGARTWRSTAMGRPSGSRS